MFSFFLLFLYTEADKALGETWIAVKCSTDELSSILNTCRNLSLAVLTNCKWKPPSSSGNYEDAKDLNEISITFPWAFSVWIVALIIVHSTNLYICQEICVVPSHFLGSSEHHLHCSLASNCQQFIHRAVARTHKKWISKFVRPNKAPTVVLHHIVYRVQCW